jgi:hypothetical protein
LIVNGEVRGGNRAARAGRGGRGNRGGRGARGAGAQVARGGPRGRPRGSKGTASRGQANEHTGNYF